MSHGQEIHPKKAQDLGEHLENHVAPGPANVKFLDVRAGDFGGSANGADFTTNLTLATQHVQATMKDVSRGIKGFGKALGDLGHDAKKADDEAANDARMMAASVATIQTNFNDPSHRHKSGHRPQG